MSSKRETILAAAKAALVSVTGVTDAHVYRSRAAAFARAESPALALEPINDTADNPNIHRLEWTLHFQVVAIFRDDVPDQAADATLVSVHSKIMGNATLLNLCTNLLPVSVDWQIVQADKTLAVVTMQFSASYQTDVNSIS